MSDQKDGYVARDARTAGAKRGDEGGNDWRAPVSLSRAKRLVSPKGICSTHGSQAHVYREQEKAAMSNAEFVATVIEGKAWKIVEAFDDVAEEQGRQPAYAALIMIMTSFIKTSEASAEDILTDFCGRVGAGVYAKPSKPQ